MTKAIETVRVGDRVLGENPDLAANQHSQATAVDPATWKKIRLRALATWDDGTVDDVNVETLQPPEWLAENHVQVSTQVPIPLDLVEMGLPEDLRAEVLAIEPSPQLASGPGKVVLNTVNHLNKHVVELAVAHAGGRQETVRPTGLHKFYSVTQHDWVRRKTCSRASSCRASTAH